MAEVHLFVEFLYQLTHFVNVEDTSGSYRYVLKPELYTSLDKN